jgi:histidine triad (HIT) family protein
MCIFCKIVAGEIPSNRVNESESFLAFHDIDPKAPIHILVIPKKHICCFQEMDSETASNITPFIQETASKVAIDKSGYRLITNNGKDGGQEVEHLHFHLLGGAKLKWEHHSDETKKSI